MTNEPTELEKAIERIDSELSLDYVDSTTEPSFNQDICKLLIAVKELAPLKVKLAKVEKEIETL